MNKRVAVGGVQLSPLEAAMVSHVFDRGFIGPGEFTATLERELAAAHGYKHCICLNSGQSALMIALEAQYRLDGLVGAEIALPAVTYISTLSAVIQAGCKPALVDVTPDVRANILWDQVPNTVAGIVPVHLFGRAIDQRGFSADKVIIEDACEAIYAKNIGFGDVMCVSFYSSHTITAGLGGAVMTNNDDLYFKMWQLVNHGRCQHDDYTDTVNLKDRFTFDEIGYSLKFSDINAAIGLGQHFSRSNLIETRELIAAQLKERIDELGWIETMPMDGNTWMMFPMRVLDGRRDQLINALNKENVETRMLMPLTNQPIVKKIFGDNVEEKYPNAKMLNETAFYVGCHPLMDDEDIDLICGVLENMS
jgi:dTDP-4-amino-4,6-dideoxygalactose transaminase